MEVSPTPPTPTHANFPQHQHPARVVCLLEMKNLHCCIIVSLLCILRSLSVLCILCVWAVVCHPSGYHTKLLIFSLSVVSDIVTPRTAARQASLSFTISWSLLRFMSIESVMLSNHLILCDHLLLLPSIFPSIRVFSSESALHIRWPKYWSFGTSPCSKNSLCSACLVFLLPNKPFSRFHTSRAQTGFTIIWFMAHSPHWSLL